MKAGDVLEGKAVRVGDVLEGKAVKAGDVLEGKAEGRKRERGKRDERTGNYRRKLWNEL